MHTPTDYKTTLEQLEQDRAHAQSVADAFAAAINHIRAALKAERAAATPALALAFELPSPRVNGPGTIPAGARLKDAVIFALRHAGRPIRVKEVYEIATAAGWKYSKDYESFRGSIAPTLKRNHIFVKTAVGLYTLADLANKQG